MVLPILDLDYVPSMCGCTNQVDLRLLRWIDIQVVPDDFWQRGFSALPSEICYATTYERHWSVIKRYKTTNHIFIQDSKTLQMC
jgi:hypothetical protein